MNSSSILQARLRHDALAAAFVGLMPLISFLPATRGELILAPDDGLLFNVPLRVAAANLITSGYVPLWNPFIFAGMPLHGVAQGGVLFPLNWFYLIFSPPVATNLMMFSAYIVAALGAYLYARRIGTGIGGAIVTSLVWQWSGFLVAQIGHTNIVQTVALLPWVLWSIDGYGTTGSRRTGAMLAVFVALQTFAGHQQTLVYSLLVAFAYGFVMAHQSLGRIRMQYLKSLVLMTAGLALGAVQILPTAEMLRNSLRSTTTYEFITSFSMPSEFLWTFFAPYVLGGGDGRLFRVPYLGPAFYGEYIAYVGLGALVLTGLALVLRRDILTKFWTIALIVALALALGANLPFDLYKVVYYIPVLNLFRVPARHLLVVDFALAVLAGRGVMVLREGLNRNQVRRVTLIVVAITVTLTVMAITVGRPNSFRLGREAPVTFLRAPELFLPVALAVITVCAILFFAFRPGRKAFALLLVVMALDLNLWGHSSGWRVSSPSSNHELWREPSVAEALRREGQQPHEYRIVTVDQVFDSDGRLSETPTTFALGLQPNIYMMHGFHNAAGYDGFGLQRYSRLAGDLKLWGQFENPSRVLLSSSRELDILNVRYLVTRPGNKEPAQQLRSTSLPPVQKYGDYLFTDQDLSVGSVAKSKRLLFQVPATAGDHLAFVTYLSWSVDILNGQTVGLIRINADDGRTFEFQIRAGEESAEWAHSRPDINRVIKHSRAHVATSFPVQDAQGHYQGHTYVASFKLPERVRITGGSVSLVPQNQAKELELRVLRLSIYDSQEDQTFPLQNGWVSLVPIEKDSDPTEKKGERWQYLASNEVVVHQNTRALPRAWLATSTVVTSEEMILNVVRTGNLPDGSSWDPRHSVLLENPISMKLSGVGTDLQADITRYEPNKIEVSTSAGVPSVLVLAENHYPGWHVSVDGRSAPLLRVNYNQRGVALEPGSHKVEFVYRPASALAGLLLSLLTGIGVGLWSLGILKHFSPFKLVQSSSRKHNLSSSSSP